MVGWIAPRLDCPWSDNMKFFGLASRKFRKYHVYMTTMFAVATFVLSFREISRLEQIQSNGSANQIAPNEFSEINQNSLHEGMVFRKQWVERNLKGKFDDVITQVKSVGTSPVSKRTSLKVKDVGRSVKDVGRSVKNVVRSVKDVSRSVTELLHTTSKRKAVKEIVWFNAPAWIPRQKGSELFGGCKYKMCTVSYDRQDLAKADVVLVDGFNLHQGAPPPRSANQIFALFSFEPPTYLTIPQNWKDAFNWTISYRPDSDIWRPYGMVRKRRSGLKGKHYEKLVKEKTNSVAWFVSRCVSHSQREKYVNELQKYVDIDVFGRCGDSKCGRDCYEKLKSYKFFLAFENSFCENYVTEKFFKTFLHDVIPVVRGGPNYKSLYGGGYIIDSKDFATIRELGYYLNFLLTNDKAYIELLREKDKQRVYFPLPWCGLCEKLHKPLVKKNYANINHWLSREKCHLPNDIIK
ncbi:glycoprotein 3-alpha-L-fucosyltransferase A-like isoform X1 [Haliotis rufescens]|uniref:glycoprotein 3-alpha-L-fucosyltransferase A-like isoform X1 n=1 Tax=Haliotis rufescens TaxID=6454 RepID=UPI00201EC34C|nr:glycoprotein 3-alpha-L-fucosyltransferase A-like isoform X1 [Haliotis rufescens]